MRFSFSATLAILFLMFSILPCFSFERIAKLTFGISRDTAQVAVANLISRLTIIEEPTSPDDLNKILDRNAIAYAGSQKDITYFSSDDRLDEPIRSIGIEGPRRDVWGPHIFVSEKTLHIEINQDMSSFKEANIKQLLRQLGEPNWSQNMNLCGQQSTTDFLTYELPDARLQFAFSDPNFSLTAIEKKWKVGASKVSARRPQSFTPPDINSIKNDIRSFQYSKATRDLMLGWSKTPNFGNQSVRNEYRDLLSQCLQLLKKPQVADYIRVAPCVHVQRTILQANCNPNLFNFSLDDYMHGIWLVKGAAEAKQGQYMILIPGSQSELVHRAENPILYDKLFELIGPLTGNEERQIPPLPAEIIDTIDFQS